MTEAEFEPLHQRLVPASVEARRRCRHALWRDQCALALRAAHRLAGFTVMMLDTLLG